MKKNVFYLVACFFVILLSSCFFVVGDRNQYDITLSNTAYYSKITKFYFQESFYSDWYPTYELLKGEKIDYRSSKFFPVLAEEGKEYNWYVEFENGFSEVGTTPRKYYRNSTIEAYPGSFNSFIIKNNVGNDYEIFYIVLQPAGFDNDCILDSDKNPIYAVFEPNSDYSNGIKFTRSTTIRNKEASMYDIFIIVWKWDASRRPKGGDYYYGHTRNFTLDTNEAYIWYINYNDLLADYWSPNILKLKNKFLQSKK